MNVEGTRAALDAARAGGRGDSCSHQLLRDLRPGPRPPGDRGRRARPAGSSTVAYKRTKLEAERLALRRPRDGLDVVVVNPTTPVGPGDRRPTPTGKMVADVARGRARAYLRTRR